MHWWPPFRSWLKTHVRDNHDLIALVAFGLLTTVVVWIGQWPAETKSRVVHWAVVIIVGLLVCAGWSRSVSRLLASAVAQEMELAHLRKAHEGYAAHLAAVESAYLRSVEDLERAHALKLAEFERRLQEQLVSAERSRLAATAGAEQMLQSLSSIGEVTKRSKGEVDDHVIADVLRTATNAASVALTSYSQSEITICVKKLDQDEDGGEMYVSRLAIAPPKDGVSRVLLSSSRALEQLKHGKRSFFYEPDADAHAYFTTHVTFPAQTILVVPIVLPGGQYFGFLWASSEKAYGFDSEVVYAYLTLVAALLSRPLSYYYSETTSEARARKSHKAQRRDA